MVVEGAVQLSVKQILENMGFHVTCISDEKLCSQAARMEHEKNTLVTMAFLLNNILK
jgi:hypothetical protein